MNPGDSDSEHVVDVSLSSEIPDLSVRADELTTDTKESEDISNIAGALSAIPQRLQEDQQTDQNSLNEFEEFERLIQQNTAVDSDEEDTNDISEKEAKSGSSHTPTYHHDTGYQTGRFENDRVSHASWRSQGHSDDEENEEAEELDSISVTYQNEQQSLHSPRTSSRRSSTRSNHSRNVSGTHDQSTLKSSHSDLDVTLDRYLAPSSPGTLEKFEDTNEKLVATFGTTEKFQELLEQQLHNDEEDDDVNSDENHPPNRNEDQTLKIEGSIGKYGRKKPSERLKRKSMNRSARSPAANRVKRAQRSALSRASSNSSFHRDSSDETSVRSDVSRGELKRRLKKESKNRKKENEVVKELQTNYDDLLTRYAEAENVIDQLRLGAKIDLFASIPSAGSSGDIVRPASSHVGHQPGTGPQNKNSSKDWDRASVGSESMDPLTESSLQLPFRASVEILRNELQMKVNDLKEQIDSFRTLLDEGDLSDVEKHQALRNIEEAARNLDRDYLQAIRDHDAERRRALVYGQGSQNGDANEEFDPQNKIKGELFNVRRMVDEVKDAVTFRGSVPQTPVSGTRSRTSVYERKEFDSSDDDNVEGNFSELLKRYTGSYPPPDNDEAHTTAPSGVLSTDTEESDVDLNSSVANSSFGKAKTSSLPERYFQPPATTPAQSSPDTSPQSKERKSTRSMTPNKASSQTPKSRLPRFVGSQGTSGGRTPDPPKKNQTGHEFEADSGFMGSESSRHSAATGSMISDPKNQNHPHRLMRPAPHPRVAQPQARQTSTPAQKKPMLEASKMSQQKPQLRQRPSMSPMRPIHPEHSSPQHSENRNKQRSNRTPLTSASNFSENTKHQNESYDDSDDLSATSTVKGLLNPNPRLAPNPGRSGSPKVAQRQRQERAKSAGSEKSRASSRRSLASSSRDSTLDMLRGEIAKLRAEIRESRNTEKETQTPSSVRDKKRNSSQERDRHSHGDSERGRTTTRRKFEEDVPRKYDPERSENPHLRSSSLNRINDENQQPSSPSSRSHPQFPTSGGHWAYISPVGMPHYPTVSPVPPPPVYYSTPQHLVPAPRVNTVYLTPPSMSTGRVYVPVQPSVQLAYTSPRVVRSPSTRERKIRKASLYVVENSDSEDDAPLSRSQLSPVKLRRSSSLSRINYRPVDTQLNLSLHRVEKASDDLRAKSMGMYRSIRDSLYKAEIMAGTM